MRERVNEPAIIHFLVLDRPSEAQKRPASSGCRGKRGFREIMSPRSRMNRMDETDSVTKVGRASENTVRDDDNASEKHLIDEQLLERRM